MKSNKASAVSILLLFSILGGSEAFIKLFGNAQETDKPIRDPPPEETPRKAETDSDPLKPTTWNIMVTMTDSVAPIVQTVLRQDFSSKNAAATTLVNALQTFSTLSQQPVLEAVKSYNVETESYWITNQVLIKGAAPELMYKLGKLSGVKKVLEEITFPIAPVFNMTVGKPPDGPEWNVKMMNAHEIWDETRGENVVVAGIDTGVRRTHTSVVSNYVGNSKNGWYDPIVFTKDPNDTIATAVGTNGVGVAPGAKWMACRGCFLANCMQHALVACGQFILCPSDPQRNKKDEECANIPDIVNNSWGGPSGQDWFDDIVSAWRAVGILPFFAVGNSGPNCETAGNPGDHPEVFGIGSTDRDDRLSKFSSRGPRMKTKDMTDPNDKGFNLKDLIQPLLSIGKSKTTTGNIKPDICAPGQAINSAGIATDSQYKVQSGTSMASPAVYFPLRSLALLWLPVLVAVSFVWRSFVCWLASWNSEYGKVLDPISSPMSNDFMDTFPKGSLAATLTLDGDISLQDLRRLFNDRVLEATLTSPKKKGIPLRYVQRYPELKQYLTTYLGYRVWKNDPNFQVENHIIENAENPGSAMAPRKVDLGKIHEEYINKPYWPKRSPWDLILIRNAIPVDGSSSRGGNHPVDNGNTETRSLRSPKSILIFRVHHCMADGRSLLKLFVECLGQKSLKCAQPQANLNLGFGQGGWNLSVETVYNFINHAITQVKLNYPSKPHAWLAKPCRFYPESEDDPDFDSHVLYTTVFSPLVSMSDVKMVAKKNGVLPSSVILSSICGAIRKFDINGGDLPVAVPQPKPNHPPYLCNVTYCGTLVFPPAGMSPRTRLLEMDSLLVEMKTTQVVQLIDCVAQSFGTMPNALSSFIGVNHYLPAAITNIAGEEEGFCVGTVPCSEFLLTAAGLRGACSAIFCVFSYKRSFRVALTAKKTALSTERAQQIVNEAVVQFELLLKDA